MDEYIKWDIDQETVNSLGINSVYIIGGIQFIVLCLLLYVLNPSFIADKKDKLYLSYPSLVKIIIISTIICVGTYFLPPFTRSVYKMKTC